MPPAPPANREYPPPVLGMPQPRPDMAAHLARHEHGLRRYLCVLGCRADLLDDLVQETVLVVLRAGFEHRADQATGSFLRKTAKNLFLQQLRHAARRREVEIADEVWRARCGDGDGDAYVTDLRECVDQLPPARRRLLADAYDSGLSRTELARRHGMQPEGVKTALRRLRAILRDCIEGKRGAR